jgi:hypothetical protein
VDIRKIRFRMSGGFAGLVRGADIEGRDLSVTERTALERLLKGKHDGHHDDARDLLTYEMDVETDQGSRRLEFDEMSTPHPIAELIKRLIKKAHPVSP